MILAIHFEIDAKGGPAGTEVGLPLQFHIAACDRQRHFLAVFRVEGDGAVGRVHVFHRDIHHPARFGVDRQEDGIGLLALFAQGFQHHFHDLIVFFRRAQQDRVELARAVEIGCADEFVFKPERVEEPAQHRVVVFAKAGMCSKRIGHGCQRLLQVFLQRFGVWHVARHLAHAVQIVGKTDQFGRDV